GCSLRFSELLLEALHLATGLVQRRFRCGLLDGDSALEVDDLRLERRELLVVLADFGLGIFGAIDHHVERASRFGQLALELGLAVDEAERGRSLGRELALRLVELATQLLLELENLGSERALGLRELLVELALDLGKPSFGRARAGLRSLDCGCAFAV